MQKSTHNKIMILGETFSGKSSLVRALSKEDYTPHRNMAIEYFGQFIITPGEFLENRRFYHALITSSADCNIMLFVQDTTRKTCLFPPLFASIFNRRVIGVCSKIDKQQANTTLAQRFLNNTGIKEVIKTSSITGEGLDLLQQVL